jgi:hypothetical protein
MGQQSSLLLIVRIEEKPPNLALFGSAKFSSRALVVMVVPKIF